jgi:RNA polymerase sigma factor (sigma-70 family)
MTSAAPPPSPREQQLVREALHVVDACAAEIARRWPRFVQRPEELRSVGTFALYHAARRFRDDMNHSFADYARRRVRGAMLDALRLDARHDRVERAAMMAADRFAAEHVLEGFDALTHDENDARDKLGDFASQLFGAMFAAGVDEVLRGGAEENVALRAEYAHAIASLSRALRAIDEREAQIVVAVYSRGKTLEEASHDFGIAYSTARARHARALARLHTFLTHLGVTRAPPIADLPGAGSALPANDARDGEAG